MRERLKRRFPKAKDLHVDCILIVLLLLGLIISAIEYWKTDGELNQVRQHADEAFAKQQPRRLSEKQRATLITSLSQGARGSVIVQSDWTDAEAANYAKEISSVLREAKFDIVAVTLQVLALRRQGIFLLVKDADHAPPHAVTIQNSFMASGIHILGLNTSEGMERGIFEGDKKPWGYDPNTVIVWVGQKP